MKRKSSWVSNYSWRSTNGNECPVNQGLSYYVHGPAKAKEAARTIVYTYSLTMKLYSVEYNINSISHLY